MTHNITGRRAEPDHYDVKIFSTSYGGIAQLIAQGDLVAHVRPPAEHDDPIKGVKCVATYRLASGVDLRPISDTQLAIGNVVLSGNFSHLLSPAYHALVCSNAEFQSHEGLDEALDLAREPQADPRHVARLLERIAQQGPNPDGMPRMSVCSQQFTAIWRPEQTLVKFSAKGHYFLCLVFESAFIRRSRAPITSHIGLDAGLAPFSTAVHDDGRRRLFMPTTLALPDRQGLTRPAAALLDRVVYASGRRDAERLLQYLTHHAHRVAAEHLRLGGMHRPYVLQSRDRALQDLHNAWLPQILNRAGIPFKRVSSGNTSIRCPRCTHTDPRNRYGRRFKCLKCGLAEHADIVGGTNVLHYDQRNLR